MNSARAARIGLLAALLAPISCTVPATEIALLVDTDLRAHAASFAVYVRRGAGSLTGEPNRVLVGDTDGGADGGLAFPQRLAVVPSASDPRDETITALIVVSSPSIALRRVARAQFVPHQTVVVRVYLPLACAETDPDPTHRCSGAPCSRQDYCESINETCGDDGLCVSATARSTGTDAAVGMDSHPVMDVAADLCTPNTCSSRCGTIDDGCGGHLSCPGCPSDYACGAGGTCQCITPTCASGQCGTISNSCASANCGGCPPDFACGAGNGCVCSPSANGVCTPGCSNICNDPDCGAHCGNGVCDCSETSADCADCVCQIRCCDDTVVPDIALTPGGHDCFWYASTAGGDRCGTVGAYRWHTSNYAVCHTRASGCPGCPGTHPGVGCPGFEWCDPPNPASCSSPYECPCLTAACCTGTPPTPIHSATCFQ